MTPGLASWPAAERCKLEEKGGQQPFSGYAVYSESLKINLLPY
jgi:hypothetical protein